jgi:hypothetical protein
MLNFRTFQKGCILLLSLVSLSSCDSFFNFNKDKEAEPLARVGDAFLYKNQLKRLLGDNMSKEDSASYVSNYINKWASKQLLLEKAKINLSEEKLEDFDRLVADYRADLYTRAYVDALLQQANDTAVSNEQLTKFYGVEKNGFKLTEKLVQLRFVGLPKQFLNKTTVIEKIKNFEDDDKKYLDSIAVQFKKIHFNDSVWVSASRVIEAIPPLNYLNVDKHLKKSQFFELQDSLGVYLVKVTDVLDTDEIAPISYIEPKIKQVILNRRRLDYIKRLELEIIDEAIKTNEFEIYGNK